MNNTRTIKAEGLLKSLCGKDFMASSFENTAIGFVFRNAAIITWHDNRMYLNFVNTFQRMEVQELVEQWAEGVTDYVASVKAAVDTIQITFYDV